MFKIIILILSFFISSNSYSEDQFNFNIKEITITDNGNIFKGFERGEITTNDGIKLNANEFEYTKNSNILIAIGDVKVVDEINNYIINSKKIIYYKNENIIFAKGNSKAENSNNSIIIEAENFEYFKSENKLVAKKNVIVKDVANHDTILSDKITYFKNEEKFVSDGDTKALINSTYNLKSKNVLFLRGINQLSSKHKTTILDNNSQFYELSNFIYEIDKKQLKGENILVITNYNLPNSDKFYFSNAIINLNKKSFVAGDTKIEIHKSIFNNKNNDPRLLGVSSEGNSEKTTINKAIFTSCKKNDNCPPWSLSAKKIEHNKKNKQISYDSAILKIYDKPVFYFPKFFHPDPTVKSQSGLLKPEINNSNILGSSLTLPYFAKISENKDFTIKPTWFDSDTIMIQHEYRQTNKDTEFIADFGLVNGFKSSSSDKKKDINHFFLNLNHNFNFKEFLSSNLKLSVEKTNNDTYLKIFEPHVTKSQARPDNFNTLKSELRIDLNHDEYNFNSGIISYENLQASKSSDRYQYILPYYNFDKVLNSNFMYGSLNFSSNGNNDLNNTNQLKSNIINNFSYNSDNFISNQGILNNFNLELKNLNSIGKNYSEYKSSPQTELISLFSINSSIPMQKIENNYHTLLTPKASLRFNPSDMKNYSSSNKKINVGNIFNTNRLGLSDTFESGKSLTLGIEYKSQIKNKEELEDINKYFELKLATVVRDKEENFIPISTTMNKKNSNIFGSIDNNLHENLKLKYDFAINNNLNRLDYNNLIATLEFENFETTLNFIEENNEMGNNSILENSIVYNFDNSNSIKFNTRRNRKLNLTEYYDLVYEYQNDCLTAGIKYKKTYYEDRDLKPSENLLFTITLFPLTNYEYSIDD